MLRAANGYYTAVIELSVGAIERSIEACLVRMAGNEVEDFRDHEQSYERADQSGLFEAETAEAMMELYRENRTESYYGGGRSTEPQAEAMADLARGVHEYVVDQIREGGVCWLYRTDVSEEDSDVGTEYGVKSGCIVLALTEIMQLLGSQLTGEPLPQDEIHHFVSENISVVSDEFQQLYAEIQLHRGENDPLYQRDELPESQRMYPDQVDLDEEDEEYPNILKEDIAISNTLRAYLQMDRSDFFTNGSQ